MSNFKAVDNVLPHFFLIKNISWQDLDQKLVHAVANTIENKPQSLVLACFWTSM